jgi:hypothetical protein
MAKIMRQQWVVVVWWKSGGIDHGRGQIATWPDGTSPLKVLQDAASDPANGFDLAICYEVSVRMVGDLFEDPFEEGGSLGREEATRR